MRFGEAERGRRRRRRTQRRRTTNFITLAESVTISDDLVLLVSEISLQEWGFNPWEYTLHSLRGLASFHLPTMPCVLWKAMCSAALMRNYVWLKQHLGDRRWSAAATSLLLPPPAKKELLLGFKRIKWVCDNGGIKREKNRIRKGPLGIKRATSRSRVQSPVVTTHNPPLCPLLTARPLSCCAGICQEC